MKSEKWGKLEINCVRRIIKQRGIALVLSFVGLLIRLEIPFLNKQTENTTVRLTQVGFQWYGNTMWVSEYLTFVICSVRVHVKNANDSFFSPTTPLNEINFR